MPYGSLSFLDLAKLKGTDQTVATIEEVTAFAPELAQLLGRTITGISSKLSIRRQLPVAAFSNPGDGVPISKSEYDDKVFNLAWLDCQMRVPKALITADNPIARAQANEAKGAFRSAGITVGGQLYYGNPAGGDKGFPGIQAQVDPSMIVDATGSTANTGSSVYFVVEGDEYFEMLYGNNGDFGMMDDVWAMQRVHGLDGSNRITSFDAYCNSLNGWIGAQVGHSKSVGVIKNLTAQNGKGLTDLLGQTALANFPTGLVPTKCLMTRRSRLQLQISRTAVNQQAYALGAVAPIPVDLAGIPIVVTDSISNTEAIR